MLRKIALTMCIVTLTLNSVWCVRQIILQEDQKEVARLQIENLKLEKLINQKAVNNE